MNSVVHREYFLSGPTLLSIFDRSVEIVSLGGLPTGITIEDIDAHISLPRNRLLANIFFRLEIIEAYGTGIRRTKESYGGSGVEPVIKVTPNAFSVFLPNRNVFLQPEKTSSIQPASLSLSERKVIDFLKEGPQKRAFIQESTGLSQTTLLRILKDLIEKRIIVKEGAGRNTVYSLM